MQYFLETKTFMFVCVFGFHLIESNEITLHKNDMKDYWKNVNKNIFYRYVKQWYEVSQEEDLHIILHDTRTTEVKCGYLDSKLLLPEQKVELKNTIIKISKHMLYSGTWRCEFYSEWNQVISFRIRVKENTPVQQILVNKIVINVTKQEDTYTAKYFYRDGERVHVDCISTDKNCRVQMSYPFIVNEGRSYETAKWGTGFSVKLRRNHNGIKINCKSTCAGNPIVEVSCYLNSNEYPVDLKIDSRDVTNIEAIGGGMYTINYGYFLNNKPMTITCENVECKNCDRKEINDNNMITLAPNIVTLVNCGKNLDLTIMFQLINSEDYSTLSLEGLDPNKVISEYREYKYLQGISNIDYVYEYESDDKPYLNCSVNNKPSFDPKDKYLNFDSQVLDLDSGTTWTKCIQMNFEKKKKTVTCFLREKTENGKIISQINVVCRMKEAPAIDNVPTLEPHTLPERSTTKASDVSETPEDSQNLLWIPATVIPICIIVFCVLILLYKMKTRKKVRQNKPEETYDYCTTESSFSYKTGQSVYHYVAPEGQMIENTLYEPGKDFYAKPVPKSQRQLAKQQNIYAAPIDSLETEQTTTGNDNAAQNSPYAIPCIKENSGTDNTKPIANEEHCYEDLSNLIIVNDVYSEPVNVKQKSEETYTNLTGEPHYSNKIGGYCVYPTYSEPQIKK